MGLTKIDFTNASKLLGNNPRCDNYLDSLLSQSESYKEKYTFLKNDCDDIFGISPEGNIHLYSEDQHSIQIFFDRIAELSINPAVIFSYSSNDFLIRESCKQRTLVSRPFFYLKKLPKKLKFTGNSVIKLATSQDQELVNSWYKSFNEEESSNWDTPQLLVSPDIKLYLIFHDDKFAGAAANTLLSNSRLWIGRLWIMPNYRKHGLATELMNHLETVAKIENKDVSLLVSNHNIKALNLYTNLEYKTISSNCFWY